MSGLPYWGGCLAVWLAAWGAVEWIVARGPRVGWAGRASSAAVPILFGLTILFLWEVVVRGLEVPGVILPPPSAVARRIIASPAVLAQDFMQTVQGLAAGYLIGSGSGFLLAVMIDRVPFLQRGLLPLGTLVSALPIVGVAPIMVMWFGFDWPSKAAVVTVMTLFPCW